MKQKLFFHSILFIVFLFIGIGVKASTRSVAIMPPESGPAGVFGEDHYYSVIFRGNGDAVVNLKAIFTNTKEATISAITLQVPKGQVQEVVAYQVLKKPRCIRYDKRKIVSPDEATENTYKAPSCLEYDNPDYYGYSYPYGTKYKKAQIQVEGDMITIHLPEGIPPESSASYLLYYRAQGYTKKDFAGAYSYTFETLKTKTPIRNLQIGISTDSNLRLKNASSDVNYAQDETAIVQHKTVPALDSEGMTNQAFERYYQQIGQGTIIRNASSLQPFDTFTVEGIYAKSGWQLYAKPLLIGLVVIILVLVVIGFGLFKLFRYFKKKTATPDSGGSHSVMNKVLWMSGSSFGSSIIAAGYTLFLFVVMNFANGYYYIGYQYNMLIVLFVLILSLGIYPLCLFAPSMVIGIKKGLWWGIGTFAMTIAWLMLYLFIIFGFLFVIGVDNNYPRPLPYVRGTTDRMVPETLETK